MASTAAGLCFILIAIVLAAVFASGLFPLEDAPRFQQLIFDEPNARLGDLGVVSDDKDSLARTFFSPAHKRAANVIAGWMRDAGLVAWIDIVGNVHGRSKWGAPNMPAIVLGSHYDTVLDAGKYDGVLGIIAAISAVKFLQQDQGWKMSGERNETLWQYPVEIVAFADEEGVRFQSTFLGSKALSGGLLVNGMLNVHDAHGQTLLDVLEKTGIGGNLSITQKLQGLVMPRDRVKSYVEIHSEQGPKLKSIGSPLGVVSGIAGQTRLQVNVVGDQNHAGTVPMSMRKDAVAGAAEAIYKIEQRCKDMDIMNVVEHLAHARHGDLSSGPCLGSQVCPSVSKEKSVTKGSPQKSSMLVCTVGQISVWPGASNVIPGSASFTIDLRSASNEDRDLALYEIYREIGLICAKRGLQCDLEKKHEAGSIDCDADITAKLAESAKEAVEVVGNMMMDMTESHTDVEIVCQNSKDGNCQNWDRSHFIPTLVSGAGHDALAMNDIGPVGMVFVRDNGISHSPREHVDAVDVAAATMTVVKYLEKEMIF